MYRRFFVGFSAILGCLAAGQAAVAGGAIVETALPTQPTGLLNDAGELIGGAIEGVNSGGAVYSLVRPSKAHPSWSIAVLLVDSNPPTEGEYVSAPIVKDRAGNLYGTTYQGGSGTCFQPNSCGTVFKLIRPAQPLTGPSQFWTKQTLFNFQTNVNPTAPLAIDAAGNLYLPDRSNVLEFSPPASGTGSWTMTTIYNDQATTTVNGLTIDSMGMLYGVAEPSSGSLAPLPEFIYKLTPPATAGAQWTRQVIQQFDTSLVLGQITLRAGHIYVATRPPTTNGACTSNTTCSVLELSYVAGAANWEAAVLHSFAGDPLGLPSGSGPSYSIQSSIPYLSFGPDGSIYGAIAPTSVAKPGSPTASIYKLAKPIAAGAAWVETALYTLNQQPNNFSAGTPMVISTNGTIFGTAVGFSGSGRDNVAFRITQP